MNDLDLDAIYERYRDGHIADLDGLWIPEWQIEKDVKDLIAEVRRLKAILNFAAKEDMHEQREQYGNEFTVEEIIAHWAEMLGKEQSMPDIYIRWLT